MSSSAHAPRFLGRAWQLLLVRGLVCAVFGLITAFWATPDDTAMRLMIAFYMLALGVVNWRISVAVRDRRVLSYALTIAIFGVIVLIAPSRAMLALVAALGFTLFGLMEATVCWMSRRTHPVVRDGVIIGAAMAGSGTILPLVQDLGPHGMLGVLGGGAIICAVVMLIGALTVRHEITSGSLPA
ncbi:hypothetical protein [Tersicoccus sp. Bi-70]|uniref:hypothetical protein n=1 Tax=Tersicoccus sp. Bi-70 TaxID=1897634 RepID=UPI000978B337|nr:hypothetical protein [Tersicoccus sp. Bi-70]OMH34243.1 hypothetical protein BGP79_03735 [Tersicoccus sp. Bi-70]